MKFLLVVSLLQQASASTTGAPSPSIPEAGGAKVTISGSMTCGFGDCNNAKKCTQACTDAVMTTLQTQKNLPEKPTGTASTPGCRRLSESDQEIINRIVASATVRRLAAGDVNFAYSFTATENQKNALVAALSPANMQGAAATQFLAALKTSLASAVPGIDTNVMTAPVFVAPTTAPSTTPSQVSAAVGSQATLPAVALLLACIW